MASRTFRLPKCWKATNSAVPANTVTELESTWGDGTIDFAANAFFALVAVNMDSGEYARVVHGPATPVETTTSAHGFEFNSRAASSDQTLAIGENIYLASQSAARCEIVFEIEVARALQVSEDGDHIITSPPSIDFVDPLRASLESTNGVLVSFQRPYVVNPTESGVLYIMVTNGGSGLHRQPDGDDLGRRRLGSDGQFGAHLGHRHANRASEPRDRLHVRPDGHADWRRRRGQARRRGPTSGRTRPSRRTSPTIRLQSLDSRRRTSILERALNEAFDGDRICQVSFNVGDTYGDGPRLRAVLHPTVPGVRPAGAPGH